jgi:hypothetical protein
MARDSVLLTYVAVDLLFVAGGVVLLIYALTTQNAGNQTSTIDNVTYNILFLQEMSSSGKPSIALEVGAFTNNE